VGDFSVEKEPVARELLAYERELVARYEKPGLVIFTPNAAANRFVLENPNAFLFAVIFDQGIAAERAWAGPYLLSERLGHFDLGRMASMGPDEMAAVISRTPALHRYINNVASWLTAAARKLIDEYQGDAGNIWGDEPTANELITRLEEFLGIGPKKAAMATQILMRDLGVNITRPSGTRIAYDTHVRRVFLRTGLVSRDDPIEIQVVARRYSPEDPGAMDLGAWYVGRNWCHPVGPRCDACRLSHVCPKQVDLGTGTGY
jgi:uncharacterized HhH-GPD family protein